MYDILFIVIITISVGSNSQDMQNFVIVSTLIDLEWPFMVVAGQRQLANE